MDFLQSRTLPYTHLQTFYNRIQSCLPPHYLNEEQLHYCLKSGMSQRLALHAHLEKTTNMDKFSDWLTEIKCIDDLIHLERSDFELLQKTTHDQDRHTNTLAEPSCRVNTNNNSSISSSNTRVNLPKVTDAECQLLYDNESCLKCCKVFVGHCSNDCPNDFPDRKSVV